VVLFLEFGSLDVLFLFSLWVLLVVACLIWLLGGCLRCGMTVVV